MGQFTIGSTLYTLLSSDATISGYIGTSPVRIYPDIAPLSAAQTFPYITYTIVSQVPTNTKGPYDQGDPSLTGPQKQKSPLDIVRVQINSFTNDYATGVNLASRIRKILDRGVGSGFTIGSGPDIDSIVYDGMSTTYEDKIKPQGVYNFQQEYVIRTISTYLALDWSNVYSTNFDGVDDYVDCGDSNVFSFGNGTTDSPFSISCWIRFNSVANSTGLMGKDSSGTDTEYQIRLGFSNLRFRLYDDSTSGYIQKSLSNPLSINTWYHIAFTYDGSSTSTGLKIYVDAVTPTQTGLTGGGTYTAMENTASPFTIGSVSNVFMNGNIDEVGMFNTELSASEILAIYNGGSPNNLTSHAGLVGYWRMGDSGAFPVVNDNSSNSNNGTCTNMIASDFQNLIP